LAEAPADVLLRYLQISADGGPLLLQRIKQRHPELTDQLDAFTNSVDSEASAPQGEIVQAKDALQSLDGEVSRMSNRLSFLKKGLELSFGPKSLLAHLLNLTWSLPHGEFEYRVTPFLRADQLKPGSPTVMLGEYESWASMGTEQVPEQIAETDDFPSPIFKMVFSKGQSCHLITIIPRSAVIYIRCGAEDQLVKVVEPSPCRYLLLATSPIACDEDLQIASGSYAAHNSTSSFLGRWLPGWLSL